jgi:hypothetical protein
MSTFQSNDDHGYDYNAQLAETEQPSLTGNYRNRAEERRMLCNLKTTEPSNADSASESVKAEDSPPPPAQPIRVYQGNEERDAVRPHTEELHNNPPARYPPRPPISSVRMVGIVSSNSAVRRREPEPGSVYRTTSMPGPRTDGPPVRNTLPRISLARITPLPPLTIDGIGPREYPHIIIPPRPAQPTSNVRRWFTSDQISLRVLMEPQAGAPDYVTPQIRDARPPPFHDTLPPPLRDDLPNWQHITYPVLARISWRMGGSITAEMVPVDGEAVIRESISRMAGTHFQSVMPRLRWEMTHTQEMLARWLARDGLEMVEVRYGEAVRDGVGSIMYAMIRPITPED